MGKILACEEPRVRLDNHGAAALSDTELLALMLAERTGATEALAMARLIIAEAGSIAGLASWRTQDYQKWAGIGPVKGAQLATVIEIGRRMMRPRDDAERLFNRPELVMDYFRPMVQGLEVEKFWVLSLNRKNRLKRITEVTSGTATTCLAHPREIFRVAIRESKQLSQRAQKALYHAGYSSRSCPPAMWRKSWPVRPATCCRSPRHIAGTRWQ